MINFKSISSGSTGNCYVVDDGKTKLMLECGIPFKKIEEGTRFKVREIKGCLLSHEH